MRHLPPSETPGLRLPFSAVDLGRLTVAAAALSAGLSCTCPQASCGGTLDVVVRDDIWPAGTWTLAVAEHSCTLLVTGGVAPSPGDVACDTGVTRGSWMTDTAGTQDPAAIELTFSFATVPQTVDVVWTWTGAETPWRSVIDPAWRDVTPRAGSCEQGCRAAHVDLEVP